jgi:hypothetical protein
MAGTSVVVHLASLGVILLGLSALAVLLLRTISNPLRQIPGPFWARFTRLWYLRKVWKGDFQKTNIELHKKYGMYIANQQ